MHLKHFARLRKSDVDYVKIIARVLCCCISWRVGYSLIVTDRSEIATTMVEWMGCVEKLVILASCIFAMFALSISVYYGKLFASELIAKFKREIMEVWKGESEIRKAQRHRMSIFLHVASCEIAIVICAFYWKQCELPRLLMRQIFHTSWLMCLAVTLSVLILSWIFIYKRYTYNRWEWFFCITPVMGFWLLASAEHFNWASLSGLLWCFAAGSVVILPIIKLEHRELDQAQPDRIGRRLLYRYGGRHIRRQVGIGLSHGVSVAVCGPWGCGKSHFINFLASSLQKKYVSQFDDIAENDTQNIYQGEFEICRVDLWQSKDKEAMWNDIAVSLVGGISGKNVQIVNRIRTLLSDLCQVVHLPFMPMADAVVQLLTTGVDGRCAGGEVLERRIQATQKGYVLVLDNVDRCSNDKVEALFPMIERLRNIRGLVTICGIAQEELERMSKHDNDIKAEVDISETIIKVFDIILPIPAISNKYATSFMRYLCERLKGNHSCLNHWIEMQELKFDTPRQIENVVNHLALIEDCYFLRLEREVGDGSSKVANEQKIRTAFYLAVLRIIFPKYAAILSSADSTSTVLKKTLEIVQREGRLKNADLEDSLEQEEAASEADVTSVLQRETNEAIENACALYAKSKLFVSLLKIITQLSNDEVQYAINQDYMNIKNLTDEECLIIESEYIKNNISLVDVIRNNMHEAYMEEDEFNLYRSFFLYELNRYNKRESRNIIQRCIDDDILKRRGFARAYLNSSALVFRLLNIAFRKFIINNNEVDDSQYEAENWALSMLERILPEMQLKPLREILSALAKPMALSRIPLSNSFRLNDSFFAYRALSYKARYHVSLLERTDARLKMITLIYPHFSIKLFQRVSNSTEEFSSSLAVFQKLWVDASGSLPQNVQNPIRRMMPHHYARVVHKLVDYLLSVARERDGIKSDAKIQDGFADSWIWLVDPYFKKLEELEYDMMQLPNWIDSINEILAELVEAKEVAAEKDKNGIEKKIEQLFLISSYLEEKK